MFNIDGSFGEGGGQILRTSLGLSVLTGKPFRIDNIRAGRKSPGLKRQHVTAVKAAARVGHAEVKGATIGSAVVTFSPQPATGGDFQFAVGSAGSATLVFQTVLPALLSAPGPSELVLEGGTHNSWAPPFDFLEKAFLPLLNRMGAKVEAKLERRGFFPAGGGRVRVTIQPVDTLSPLNLHERGEIKATRATAMVSRLSADVARRELKVLETRLAISPTALQTIEDTTSPGPGNAVFVEIESENVTELFTGFGRKGVRAEGVADDLATEVKGYLKNGAPVGEHLADQLLIPLALAGSDGFTTGPLTEHATTNVSVIERFLPVKFRMSEAGKSRVRVDVTSS